MLEQGIAVGLGSDSVASNNTCDLLEEARFALLLARPDADISAGDNVDSRGVGEHTTQRMAADEVFNVATIGGARALGLAGNIGELKAGLQADFAVVSLDGPHQVPTYDPVSTLVFASSGRDVILTVVAGREVYREGRVTTVDEDLLRARMSEIAGKLKA
jgi:5-methylthioadenosine/S-adenosylhomocysteine deaminase